MASAANMTSSEVNKVDAAPHVAVSAQASTTNSGLLLAVGGACGVVGAVLTFVANGLHPHPDDFHLEALLQEIAQSTTWSAIHLILIFGLLLIFGALLAVALTTEHQPAAIVARFACLATLVGGSLILVSTAGDGFAMNQLARAWLQAPPEQKATALAIAGELEVAQYAVYSLSIVLFLGVGIFLYGLSTALSSAYPKALGWLAMISGSGAFVVGVVQAFQGPEYRATEIFFVVFSILSTIWVLIMGVLMWRKARGNRVGEHAPVDTAHRQATVR